MLNGEDIEKIQEDLNNGLGVSKTAKKHKVNRGTVYRIKNGIIHPDQREERLAKAENSNTNIYLMLLARRYSKCITCGCVVQKPCLYCALQKKDWKRWKLSQARNLKITLKRA